MEKRDAFTASSAAEVVRCTLIYCRPLKMHILWTGRKKEKSILMTHLDLESHALVVVQ